MPDEKPDPGGSKTHRRTRAAEVADAVSEGTARIAKLSPQQILSVVAIISLGFICAMQALQVYYEREERKAVIQERQDASAAQMRENNAQSELTRQHCASEAKELRTFFADQNEKRMRFEAGERDKDRAALVALVARLGELERVLKKP
jgi:hypothetical protein